MACGLSRMLCGQVIPSERKDHYMVEQWNPLGLIGVITAFNFPNAVFGWNFCIAAVCGNLTLWKGSPTVPLMTIATTKIIAEVLNRNNITPGVLTCACDKVAEIGKLMVEDKRLPLISFTGSCQVGKIISERVANRFGKTLLELGGNNAFIVMEDANLELALKAATFGAVGTCGQRCTSTRRLMIHESIYDKFV